MPKARCSLQVMFPNAAEASNAAALVKREAAFKKRGSARVSIKSSALTIEINADDLPAMRAMLNTYLRTLQVAESVARVVEEKEGSG